jgi:hypothetical protein
MAFIIGKIKCYICGEKDGLFHSVCSYGIYGEVGGRIFYHPECVRMIELEPEKFGHKLMDKVLYLAELENKCKPKNKNVVKDYKDKVNKLLSNNFNRMIPKS